MATPPPIENPYRSVSRRPAEPTSQPGAGASPTPHRADPTGHDQGDPIPPPRSTPRPASEIIELLAGVLAELRYPAARWQILAAAAYYGADSTTTRQLRQLPMCTYRSLAHIAHTLAHHQQSS